MLFNSYAFIFLYLPIVFFGFLVAAKKSEKLAALWLVLASLFFYGWWNPKFVLLLFSSICFNFLAGYFISRSGRNKSLLIFSIALNIALLLFYKYSNFFISTANDLGANFQLLDIVLPLGISFFTFTQIAYLVDVYEGGVNEYDFIHYLLFVTWFPHLIAGPVLHHKQLMPQFDNHASYRLNVDSIIVGLSFFSFGLFKKVVLADQFAVFANPLFSADGPSDPMAIASWVGAIAYTFQLYFDFSGYSDMAIGLSRIFNIHLPVNFDSPYKASNIIDFWRRWHITLSEFLRDYLYIPLGGNKKGSMRRHINLFSVMLLGGLWHGSSWNFVLWGGLHGVYLIFNHLWRYLCNSHKRVASPLFKVLSSSITFALVVVAWVPFRSSSIADTIEIWRGMVGLNGVGLALRDVFPGGGISAQEAFRWILGGAFIVFFLPNTQGLMQKFISMRKIISQESLTAGSRLDAIFGLIVGLVFLISILLFKKNSPFIYFQF